MTEVAKIAGTPLGRLRRALLPRDAGVTAWIAGVIALVLGIISVFGFRDWYYSFVRLKSSPLLPVAQVLMHITPLALLASRAFSPATRRVVDGCLIRGILLGILLASFIGQRSLFVRACRRGQSASCCAAVLLDDDSADVRRGLRCHDPRTVACAKLKIARPTLCSR
jgi:hypothetical protein